MLLFSPNTFPSRLLSKNLKIKILKTIILPVVLHGYEAWYLTLRVSLRVIENRILRRIFGPYRHANEEWRWLQGFTMRKCIVYTVHLT